MKFQPNLNRIFQFYKFEIVDKCIREKIILLIKSIILLAIKPYKINNKDLSSEFVFFTSTFRKDHLKFFHDIYNICEYDKELPMYDLEYNINTKIVPNIVYCCSQMAKTETEMSLIDKMIIVMKASRLLSIFNKFKPIKCKHLIVYSEAQPIEDILVQYCKSQFINTISLQHGLFVDYQNSPNINMLNYHDVKTDLVLVWGETSKELFEKYNPKLKIEICGKPLALNGMEVQKKPNIIGVVFDQPMFREYNKKMLQISYEIAARNNMKVVLRMHPADDSKYYELDKSQTEYNSSVYDSSYILAHTTTMIYEYLALGYKVFKFRSDVPANEIDEAIIFGSAEELANKLDMNFDFYKESLRHIGYVGDESKMKYKEFFDKLHDNNLEINNSLE